MVGGLGREAAGIHLNSVFSSSMDEASRCCANSAPTWTVPDVFMAASGLRADSPFPLPDSAGLRRKRCRLLTQRETQQTLASELFVSVSHFRNDVPLLSRPRVCPRSVKRAAG